MNTVNRVTLSEGNYVHSDGRVLGNSITVEITSEPIRVEDDGVANRLYPANLIHPDGTQEEIALVSGTTLVEIARLVEALLVSLEVPATRHVLAITNGQMEVVQPVIPVEIIQP